MDITIQGALATLLTMMVLLLLSFRVRRVGRVAATCLVVVLAFSVAAVAEPVTQESPSDFFHSIVGEWIGVCEQSTNDEPADNKYFHVVVKQNGEKAFDTHFNYYRACENTDKPLKIGKAEIRTTIEPDGTARNVIIGEGTVLVDYKPKDQRHELVEVVYANGHSELHGQGTGKVEVMGMPFGLGKNGRVRDSNSVWALNGDTLVIEQTLRLDFRFLVFNRSFDIAACYNAVRGTDVATLMKKSNQISSTPMLATYAVGL